MDPLNCHIEFVGGRPYRVPNPSPPAKTSRRDEAGTRPPREVIEDEPIPEEAQPPPRVAESEPPSRTLAPKQVAQRPSPAPKAPAAPSPAPRGPVPSPPPEAVQPKEPQVDARIMAMIKEDGPNTFTASYPCDPVLFPHLIGRQGTTKNRVEQDTGASLTFPRRDPASGAQQPDVSIKGPSQQAVALAYKAMQMQIASVLGGRGPSSPDYNFFVSLPLQGASIKQGVVAFQQQAVEAYQKASGGPLDPGVLNRPETLHLTLLMLKLYSDEARAQAAQVLKGLTPHINDTLLGGTPLKVGLRGLAIMNDNPAAANVLYAKVVDEGGRVSQLCSLVIKAFAEAGLLMPSQDTGSVKLHATLINTRLAKNRNSKPGERSTLDLRSILSLNLDLGSHVLPAVHLSQRHAYDTTGYYLCAAAVELPAGTA